MSYGMMMNLKVGFTAIEIPSTIGVLLGRRFVHATLLLLLASGFSVFDDFRD